MQRYTSLDDLIADDVRSFPECGGTSIDAVLMTEDLQHAFTCHYSNDAADKLPLLLDRILHRPFSDIVEYISSQLGHSTVAAAASSNSNDENPAKSERDPEDILVNTQLTIPANDEVNMPSSLPSDTSRQSQSLHGTNVAPFDQKSCLRSDRTSKLVSAVKRRRTSESDGHTSTTCPAAGDVL